MPEQFTIQTYHAVCDKLALIDIDLGNILSRYGYPPMWSRPNTFESLLHIILEQQVSLASALSALNKLKDRVQEITPSGILLLNDAELKACYFSRQKTSYVRNLAEALISGKIDLAAYHHQENEDIRRQLTAIKGIGNWTVDVYLMFVLHRADIFPIGDLAAVSALKKVKSLSAITTKAEMLSITEQWKPYRTVACMLLWHYYLS